MKHVFYSLSIFLLFVSIGVNAQITITTSASGTCLATDTLTAHLVGDVPADCSIGEDDIYSSPFSIGFTFKFYGTNYTQVLVGANGTLCFDMSLAGAYAPYAISSGLLGNVDALTSICGPWCDIDYADYGGTCTYSTDGVAPNRKFVVTFCQCYMFTSTLCPGEFTTTQMILYETTNIIEVHMAHKTVCTAWNNGAGICGVQNAAGTSATVAPGRDYPPTWTAIDEAWRFTPIGTTNYSVASIPYAPVPYASSLIYWYNAVTHAFLGTGTSIVVSPTTTTTYEAAAVGCADTTFAFVTIAAGSGPHITAITGTNPTSCSLSNGTITLHGITPHQIDTMYETIGGVLVPVWIDSSATDSTITLTGLAAGTYTFYLTVGPCASNTVTITLTGSSLAFTETYTNPTLCGKCDATIKLHGLWAGYVATVNYNFDGVPQTYTATVAPDSTVTLSGLCIRYPSSSFTSIIVSMGGCTATGPDITLTSPAINDYGVNPSLCGTKDGYIKLYNLPADSITTVTYTGALGSPVTLTVAANDTLTIPNLYGGTYGGITATINIAHCPAPNLTLTMPTINGFGVSPSICGRKDGYIKLYNLPADSIFTVTFSGAVGSPTIAMVDANDTLTLPMLGGGNYTSIVATINGLQCLIPDISLTMPTITGYGVSPSICGKRDGYIKLYNLPADSTFTVTYTGAVGSPTTAVVAADDTLTIPYLAGGTYNALTATVNGVQCLAPVITLTNPPISDVSVSPTICGKNDGSITLFNLPADSVFQVTFTGPGAGSGETLTVGANDSLLIPALVGGAYTGIIATIHGVQCPAPDVTLIDSPVITSFTDSIILGCKGESVFFTGLSHPEGYTYTWNFGDGTPNYQTNNNTVPHTYYDYPSYQGTYTVTLVYQTSTTDPACTATVSHTINFNHPVAAAFSPIIDTVCLIPPTSISFVNTSIGAGASYLWSFGDGNTSTATIPVYTYSVGGTYTTKLTVTDNIGCDSTVYGYVDVIKVGVHTITHDTTVCLNAPMELIAHPEGQATFKSVSFAWLPNIDLSSYTDSITYFMGVNDIVYTVTATTTPLGCTASDIEVIHSLPPLTLTNLTQSQTIPYGSSIQLNADGADYYTWYPADGSLNNTNISNPIATPLDSTTYTVYGMSYLGCRDSELITIAIDYGVSWFIPTAFTPNGDGLNDKFRVVNLKYQKLVDMKIFNRWGNELYHTTNPNDGWDGTYQGVPQDMDTYNYVIILSRPDGENKVYTGTVTLVR